MSHRYTRALTALILIGAGACAPVRPAPGALAPVQARTTNEVLAADLATIDAWEARRAALLRNDGADLTTRTVTLARAGAWLAFARDAYAARPRARDADDALAEARWLIEPLERGQTVAATAPLPPRSTLASAADQLRPDLWAEVERLASKPAAVRDVASLADAEIELVRAAALRNVAPSRPQFPVRLAGASTGSSTPSEVALPTNVTEVSISSLACPQVQHVARAERLLMDADMSSEAVAERLTSSSNLPSKARAVHFRVASDQLTAPSASLLSGVVDAMRAHPELSLVIEGHADPRGRDVSNLLLSGRRASTVRDLLASDGVDEERVMVRKFGASHRDGLGSSALDYARDRRVQLKFVLPDGLELPVTNDAADLQIEPVKPPRAASRQPDKRRALTTAPRSKRGAKSKKVTR
jgi:outer membrane protein OmpA-like peptidoglycan-associated protein